MRAAVALLVICSGGGTSVDVSTLDELQEYCAKFGTVVRIRMPKTTAAFNGTAIVEFEDKGSVETMATAAELTLRRPRLLRPSC